MREIIQPALQVSSLDALRSHPYGKNAAQVGTVREDSPGRVLVKTLIGGSIIRVRINVAAASLNAGVDIVLGLRIRDMTAGGTPVIWTRSGAGSGDASGWKIVGYAAQAYGPPVSTVVELTVPSTGDRAWRLEYSFSGGAGGVKIRDVSCEFLGLVA